MKITKERTKQFYNKNKPKIRLALCILLLIIAIASIVLSAMLAFGGLDIFKPHNANVAFAFDVNDTISGFYCNTAIEVDFTRFETKWTTLSNGDKYCEFFKGKFFNGEYASVGAVYSAVEEEYFLSISDSELIYGEPLYTESTGWVLDILSNGFYSYSSNWGSGYLATTILNMIDTPLWSNLICESPFGTLEEQLADLQAEYDALDSYARSLYNELIELYQSTEQLIDEAEDAAYDIGFEQGYGWGYSQGRFEVEQDSTTVVDGIIAVVDSPFRILKNIFDFEVFGINIAGVIFFLISIVLVGFVIKMFLR